MLSQSQKDQVLKYIQSLTVRSFTFRDVVRILDLNSDNRRSLQRYLDDLDAEEVIHRVKRGQYSIPEREHLVSGTLSCHKDGYGFLIPEDRRKYKEDIFVPARSMEDALHEDRVLVKVIRKRYPAKRVFRGRRSHWEEAKERIEGVVVRVLERKHKTIVGRFCAHPRFPYVIPLDTHISHEIRIPFQATKDAKDDQIVSVALTLPPGQNQMPQGKVEEILGFIDDPGIEYKIVEHKFGLPVVFSSGAIREAEAIADHVLEEEYKGREDFREELIVTIDGETAKDFDDAVGLTRLPSGNYLLGVHISDVSHYVREGSSLDEDAYARGTSVYFPDRAIPMLPDKLSSGICSLKPEADRLVLSALMEIDSKGKVMRKRFARGVIRSSARMTYTSVAKILIAQDSGERRLYSAYIPMLEMMENVCQILSKNRYGRGAVDFDLPEAEMEFDKEGKVISVVPAERNIAHRIIEEFMLMANECVAETLIDSGRTALFRVHEAPDAVKVEEFAEFARNLGYKLEKRDDQYRPKDFQRFVMRLEGKIEQRFLVYLMLRSFMQAHYSDKNLGHFGLATAAYTHFTSPIRRYPDLTVHRLIKAHLDWTPIAESRTKVRLADIAAHTSARERIADEAERKIEKIKKAQFMADKLGEEFEAIVTSASKQGLYLELLDPFVEGFVPFGFLIDDDYQYREATRSFVGKRRNSRFQLGSKVRVCLDSVDKETGRMTFSIAGRR